MWFLHSGGTASVTYKLFYGATVLETISYAPFNNISEDYFDYTVLNNPGVQNAQTNSRFDCVNLAGQSGAAVGTITVTSTADLSVPGVIKWTANGAGTETIVPRNWMIEAIQ